MIEPTLLTKILVFGFIILIFYKTNIISIVFNKVSSLINKIFGFSNESFKEVKSDKDRRKAINKMLNRKKFKGEV